jgi:hypothetical protein
MILTLSPSHSTFIVKTLNYPLIAGQALTKNPDLRNYICFGALIRLSQKSLKVDPFTLTGLSNTIQLS